MGVWGRVCLGVVTHFLPALVVDQSRAHNVKRIAVFDLVQHSLNVLHQCFVHPWAEAYAGDGCKVDRNVERQWAGVLGSPDEPELLRGLEGATLEKWQVLDGRLGSLVLRQLAVLNRICSNADCLHY